MRPPFPGMDPWLEHPSLWPDVHNSLIAAIRDELVPRVAPKYYIGLEQRVYMMEDGELVFVGRPDVLVGRRPGASPAPKPTGSAGAAGVGVLDVEVEIDNVEEWYLEIHEITTGILVTSMEILSPANKLRTQGREAYLEKRRRVLSSQSNLVEIDLLRAGEPLPLRRAVPPSDYRVLVSRGATRPGAKLYTIDLRQPIPAIPIPLLPEDIEPNLDLGSVLHALYDRARFDLRIDYAKSPVPPLDPDDAEWARSIMGSRPTG